MTMHFVFSLTAALNEILDLDKQNFVWRQFMNIPIKDEENIFTRQQL
jgi:hypothetical protein